MTNEVSSDKEKAIAIFNYIRDDVEFFIDPYFETASNTLKAVKGFCASKANLQVALLRAVNIPARYHIFHVKKELMEPFLPKWLLKFFPDIIDHHPTCECYLNGEWIACEATQATFKKYLGFGVRFGTDSSLAFTTGFGDAVKLTYPDSRPFVFSTKNQQKIIQRLLKLNENLVIE